MTSPGGREIHRTMDLPASGSERDSKAFGLLAEPIQRWIWQQQWTALHDIQEESIPFLLNCDDDLVIAAPTAAGKTEAAFLPLISRLLSSESGNGFDLVYVSPLKALINDQFRRLRDLCEKLEVPVHPWHGDISQSAKARARRFPSGILLITPESLEAMFVLRGQDIPRLFSDTQAVVIDELHTLLDSERGVHLRSLLARLEISVGNRIRRVGLSATLGDMDLVCKTLQPDSEKRAKLLVSSSSNQELRIQLKAYVAGPTTDDPQQNKAAMRALGQHIFKHFRGQNNLVFANSRSRVEMYSDMLRKMCDEEKIPNEFFPHHGNLARHLRTDLERQLKEARVPVTAICTSTLELGIDIGAVECVGQIGAPWSVASLRQRLGRSGRRPSQAAVLRMYSIEPATSSKADLVHTFHLPLVRSIALVELLVKKWYEPPAPAALHLSTLTHQILSVIAERGGVTAKRLYWTLCKRGPFRLVRSGLFARLLRHLVDPDVGLIEQAPDGHIMLGPKGEKLVEHYSFYAVFKTPQEYRVVSGGKALGTLPLLKPLIAGATIIFAGRRWCVIQVRDKNKVVEVVPDRSGKPPIFDGQLGDVHDIVVQQMRKVLLADAIPRYLDRNAASLLSSARDSFQSSGLVSRPILELGGGGHLVATWAGTVGTSSLATVLTCLDYQVSEYDGMIELTSSGSNSKSLMQDLQAIEGGEFDLTELIASRINLVRSEKYHDYLGTDLLLQDTLSRSLDLDAVKRIVSELCTQ